MRKAIFIFLTLSLSGFAEYTLKEGKLVEKSQVSTQNAQELYHAILEAYEAKDWKKLEKDSILAIKNFPSTPFGRDATYFLGAAYFNLEDYEMANIKLTDYLTHQAAPKYFEEAIEYKFHIANQFRLGARKHLMGFKAMPKWVPAGAEAIEIYDEVISALPHHELAARSLFGKAQILGKREDYRAAIECYQMLIRRFSKHPLAVHSYIKIGEIYLAQSQTEYPDPDFLDLAELNMRKFRESFPSEEKLEIGMKNLARMQDHYAANFFDTARFYERTKKWGAAKIYYEKIVKSYPKSQIATKSQDRLNVVKEKLARIESKKAKSVK